MKFSLASIVALVALFSRASAASVMHCTSNCHPSKSDTGANEHISRRRARCTSMSIYVHLCSSTPLLLIILKDLKCESCLLDWPRRSYWKHCLGPDGLTCCGPLVDAVGTWVNMSANFDHTEQWLICVNVNKLHPRNSWCMQSPD